MHVRFLILAVMATTLGACVQPNGTAPTGQMLVPPDLGRTDEAALASPLVTELPAALARSDGPYVTPLTAFYRDRRFTPVWYDKGAYAEHRALAAATLADANLAPPPVAADGPPRTRADYEVALTAAALAFAEAPPTAAPPGAQALFAALADAVADATPVAMAMPFGRQTYGIERYAAIADDGDWPTVADGPTLEPGTADARVPDLRRRLAISGDYVGAPGEDELFDAELVAAVERFQRRHGLAVDGEVGPATRRALNVSAAARLAQLRRSAARLDALEPRFGERYVVVNLPAFELRYVRDGRVAHGTDVIIGSRDDQTIEFSDEIDHVVFNPYWHVPASIAAEEIIPDLRADAARMEQRGFQVVDANGTTLAPTAVDWNTVSAQDLPYRFRQGPGAGNALGEVKFMFPNRHAIYLHDTPSKSLFARPMRALSHGCIRVRDPLLLAERLLEPEGFDRDAIDGWVETRRNHHVYLDQPVPVHLVYVTSWVDADGLVHFRDDVYARDHAYADAS